MARTMESEPDVALHPSPVLTEAVLKVEQVVARLQDLQTTISGLHLSPVNPKHTRASRTSNASSRVLSSKERTSVKDGAGSSRHRDEYKRNVLRDYKPGNKAQPERTTKSKGAFSSPSPSNQVHDVITEILMASQFAKQIATLVAEALQEAPQKTTHPRSRSCKNGKQRDIPFPSIKAKPAPPKSSIKDVKSAPKSKDAKLAPASKLIPAAKSSRQVSKRRDSSSSDSLSPPRLVSHSPEQKRRNQKLFVSPESSFRDSGDADDELSFPRRASTNVTEIRGQTKPWKRTPTKGVLFSNPVYLCTSPTRAPRPSPTSGRRRNLLPNQQLMPSDGERKESSRPGNPLRTSISKATFKREGGASKSEASSTKRDHRIRKSLVEMVPHKTMSQVLKLKDHGGSGAVSRHLLPRNALADKNIDRNEMVKPDVDVESKHEEAVGVHQVVAEKENVPSCAMFLRSMSGAHTLTRTLSRKNSGGSLFRRAKGWMSSQAIRPGKGLELER